MIGADSNPSRNESHNVIDKLSKESLLYLNQLQQIFGDKAEITINESSENPAFNQEIIIKTVLKNGFLEGGQEVEIRTSEPHRQVIVGADGWQGVSVFVADSLIINGDDKIQQDLPPLRFIAKDESQRVFGSARTRMQYTEANATISTEILDHHYNLPGHFLVQEYPGKGAIFSGSLVYGDDLGIILHEKGHADDPDNTYIETESVRNAFLYDIQEVIKNRVGVEADRNLKRGMINHWLYILRLEVQANLNALKTVARGPRKENWAKIFPVDSDGGYMRLYKLYMTTNYMRYFQSVGAWFKQQALEENMDIPQFIAPQTEDE